MIGERMSQKYDCIVLGGGIFGCHVALELRKQRLKVALFEPNELLSGATTVNQGRVHAGFHYPRSAATAMTAARYYEKFLIDFAPAISRNTKHLYLIAEESKVSPIDYEKVLDEIGASYRKVNTPGFFKPSKIQQTYETNEASFNVSKMRELITLQLHLSGITIIKDYGFIAYDQIKNDKFFVRIGLSNDYIETDYIFNCTYSSLDRRATIRTKLRKEHVEVAQIWIPGINSLLYQDITLMDGPFWSLMHYPGMGQYRLLTHVKHGRHHIWETPEEEPEWDKESKASLMIEDMLSYLQGTNIQKLSHKSSMFTTRTLVADTMGDDSRPVIVEFSPETPRIISILGSKFNSIYDLDEFLKEGEWAHA